MYAYIITLLSVFYNDACEGLSRAGLGCSLFDDLHALSIELYSALEINNEVKY